MEWIILTCWSLMVRNKYLIKGRYFITARFLSILTLKSVSEALLASHPWNMPLVRFRQIRRGWNWMGHFRLWFMLMMLMYWLQGYILQENAEALLSSSKDICLEGSAVSRQIQPVKIGNKSFENVTEFKYSVTAVTKQNSICEHLMSRLDSWEYLPPFCPKSCLPGCCLAIYKD